MKTRLNFGKIDYNDKNRKVNEVVVEMELKENKEGQKCFSASAAVYNSRHTNWEMGGQCLDDIQALVERDTPYGAEYGEIVRLWQAYHLNDSHAGTPEQEKALKEAGLNGFAAQYDECCEYLKGIGLYEVALPDGSLYKFGTGWLTEEIPERDLQEIEDIIQNGMRVIQNYLEDKENEQAEELQNNSFDDMER